MWFLLSSFSLWPPCVADADMIFFVLWFLLLLSIYLFSSPILSRRRLDVYHTFTCHTRCGLGANLGRRSETCCMRLAEIQDAKNRQKPYNVVNFEVHHIVRFLPIGPLPAEIVSLVWGTPANFNRFRVLAALLHGTLVVGVSQTLRRWTEGATYIRQRGHYVAH